MNKTTRQVKVGKLLIGGGAPITIQSMLNARADDIEGNIRQARELEVAGCEIIRVAVPDADSVALIDALKNCVTMAVVADIHFDYKLAIAAAEAGADKIRINPGNIGEDSRVKAVVDACRQKNIPIRIGVNSGSVEKSILERHGGATAAALLESACYHARLLNRFDFDNIVISLKASHLKTMLAAYRLAAEQLDYPLHLGVTEAGTAKIGLLKSAIGIGSLLCDGIGDTIRVSLTADPIEEIEAARNILKAVGATGSGVQVISCPTCGRTKIDLIRMATEVERRTRHIQNDITVAVMGCVVNGIGEGRAADIGIAGGEGSGVIFSKGEIIGKFPQERLVEELLAEIERI